MTLNADHLARLGATHIDAQWRIYVGGPRRSVAEQDVTAGATYTALPSSTTTGAVSITATVVPVVSTSGFASSGAIWLDDGSGNPEMVEYSGKTATSFTGLTRLTPTDHGSGATVQAWTDVTNKVTGLRFDEGYQSEEFGTWSCELSGNRYDSRLLAQNNAVLILARWWPEPSSGTNWSDWQVLCQGYLGPGTMEDDYRRGAAWSRGVQGIDLYLGNADAPARRYGRANLAIGQPVTASTALANSSLIGHSGEVVGTQDVSGGNVVDDSLSTVYCSSIIPQVVEGDTTFAGFDGVFIAEVGWGPVGTGDDGAYFVLWSSKEVPVRFNSFINRQATYDGGGALIAPGFGGIQLATKDNEQLPTVPAKGRIIFCRNRETFESWAGPQDAEIVEWRTLPGGASFVLRQAGDVLAFASNFTGIEDVQVRWGDEATGTDWAGLGAQGYGQALYRPNFAVNARNATDWAETNRPVPGRNATDDAQAYVSVELPQLSITLGADVNASATTIPISPATTGLNQNGGRIQIDSEQVDYASANVSALLGCIRGANGTTAASHTAGAVVYAVEGSTAHLDEYIGQISWSRKRVLDGNGDPIVLRDFSVWVSRLSSPTYPDGSGGDFGTWGPDWSQVATVSDNGGVSWTTPDAWPGGLAQHVMVVCDRMSNEGRFLLNELSALRHADYDPSSTVVETAGGVVAQILADFGLPAAQQAVTDFGPIGTRLVTSRGRYLDRLQELAQLVGGVVRISRDNRLIFERSPWHPLAGLPESAASLNRGNGRRIQGTDGPRNVVGQVVIMAQNPESGESFRVQWPGVARSLGETVEIERVFYGSQNEARYLAQLIFRQINTQREEIFIPKGHGDGFGVGDRVTLTWGRDASGDEYAGRNFIVVGIGLELTHPASEAKRVRWTLRLKEWIV